MKKGWFGICLLFLTVSCLAQSEEETAIRKVMADQAAAWNKGDIDGFMKGYWNSDSLMFIGQSGITYGYQQTLAGYKKNYNGPDQMGQLFFTLLKIKSLSPDYCFVIGKWLLKRKAGDVGGIFTLMFRRFGSQWLIVADHTS